MTQTSNTELTRSQHYVPRIYQKGWAPGRWQTEGYPKECVVWMHDLLKQKAFPTNPNPMLTSNWFYEDESNAPTNELEHWFGTYESKYAKIMRFLDNSLEIFAGLLAENGYKTGDVWAETLKKIADKSPEFLVFLKEFAATCYARTPEIMALKRSELEADPCVGAEKAEEVTRPYDFVKYFQESTLCQRFQSLHLQVWIAPDGGLVTCDRPCYDMGDPSRGYWPLAGYDIGRRDDVMAFMPLSPQLGIYLVPPLLKTLIGQSTFPPFSTKVLTSAEVATVNKMTINVAGRWVIGAARSSGIFGQRTEPIRYAAETR